MGYRQSHLVPFDATTFSLESCTDSVLPRPGNNHMPSDREGVYLARLAVMIWASVARVITLNVQGRA